MSAGSVDRPPTVSVHSGGSPPHRGWLGRFVFGLDDWLCRRFGVIEFSTHPDCIFRIELRRLDHAITLSGGTALRPGDAIVQLHFWTERVPQYDGAGAGFEFARRFNRALVFSLRELATFLAVRDLTAVQVARGYPAPVFHACDLRDVDSLRAAIDQVSARGGPIRVLVNNAGNDDRHKSQDVTAAYWDDRMAVNLRHQFFAAQAVRPGMRDAGGGSIINFGSITWLVGDGDCPAYVTAKAAITGLTRALASEFGSERIRVNCILPGWVMTERQIKLWLTPEGERQIEERQCLPDRLQPGDIARMALFLASDDSRMCTSQNFIVDGGWV